jgi:predicted MPP superfamily phosphohydrolase
MNRRFMLTHVKITPSATGVPLLDPPLGQRYPAGLQTVAGAPWPVYTNRGIGAIYPPLRFNCRPEIALITLLRGS